MPASRSTRRQFLKSSTAFGAAAILTSPIERAFGYASSTERPVFATIGLRNQGWAITNKTFKFADFAAMADVDENVLGANIQKAKGRQKNAPEGFGDYRKVLDRQDIDAVMIATPDHWHTKVAVEAMLAGKDVYCEKPLTLTIAEGKLIEEVVKKTKKVFQVGTMQRTESGQRFIQAVALVRAGRIGKVKKVTGLKRKKPHNVEDDLCDGCALVPTAHNSEEVCGEGGREEQKDKASGQKGDSPSLWCETETNKVTTTFVVAH